MKRSESLAAILVIVAIFSCATGSSGAATAETQDTEWTRIWIAEVIGSEISLPVEYTPHVGYVQRQTVQVRPLRTVKGPPKDAVHSIEHHVFLSEPLKDKPLATGDHVTVYEQAASPSEPAFTLIKRLREVDEGPTSDPDRP
ncbi:hypothetical protein [Brevundimonas sp.]|uniref:hypothetical protein n=1 Tax=Brevundimonas sp. TaxID=1871086 RepID=UPI003D6D12BD